MRSALGAGFAPEVLDAWIRASAIAVMALVPAITAAGFLMARRVATVKGRVTDVFELTDAHGRKLDEGAKERVRRALAQGTGARRTTRQRLRRAWPRKSHTIETFERPF